jgi:two-component system, NarL family, sensor histidine kinase UhpB
MEQQPPASNPAPSDTFLQTETDPAAGKLSEQELIRHRDRLDALVKERTAALEARNAQLLVEAGERKKVERALSRSEQRYRCIVEDQTVYVSRYLPGGIFTFVNNALAGITGLTPEQLVGSSFLPFLHEDDRAQVMRTVESLTLKNSIAMLENRVLLEDGTHWHVWEHRALFDESGSIVEYQAIGRDITRQRLAEKSLQESERAYRAVVEDQSEFITRFRPDGSYLFVNGAFCRFFGKTREQVVGSNWRPDALADDIPMIEARLAQLTPENPVVVIENRVISGSGAERWIQFVNRGFFNGDGDLVETQAVGRDITGTKQLEKVLRESELRYSALFANKISAIAHCRVITDEKGLPVDYRILQVNEAYERIIGIRKADIEGRTVREVFPGVENNSFDYIGVLGRIALEGGEASYETLLEATGQYLSIYTYSPSPGEFTTIFTDISERKRGDEALRKSESDLTEAQRVAHIGSWHWDAVADTIWWSDELYRIYQKVPGASLPSYQQDQGNYTPESAARLTAVVQETMKSGAPYLIDLERRVGAGPRKWVQGRGEAVRDASGQITGLRGTVQDITDRKRDEETLQRYAHRLIVLEEDLRKKVSRELHDDIGQELTALGLNLAHIGCHLHPEASDDLRATLADSRALTKEISRSVRNLMVELRPTQLEEYGLASAIRSYARQFEQRTGLAVAVQDAPQFPRLASHTEINLFRITQEALTNSAQHAFADRVRIDLELSGSCARLTITDNGNGFLRQSPAATGSSGWGLTIMRERADLVGGSFQLKSEPGAGTSITIEIKGEF